MTACISLFECTDFYAFNLQSIRFCAAWASVVFLVFSLTPFPTAWVVVVVAGSKFGGALRGIY